MIETGFLVFISLIVMLMWLPRNKILWLFGHPVWLELPFGVAAYALHYGTFSGMMAAAVAAVMCAIFTRLGKAIVGYIKDGIYVPGVITLEKV